VFEGFYLRVNDFLPIACPCSFRSCALVGILCSWGLCVLGLSTGENSDCVVLGFAVDIFFAVQVAGQCAKAKLVKSLKTLLSQGSWKGWFLVGLLDGAGLGLTIALGTGVARGTCVELVDWLLDDTQGPLSLVCICIRMIYTGATGACCCLTVTIVPPVGAPQKVGYDGHV